MFFFILNSTYTKDEKNKSFTQVFFFFLTSLFILFFLPFSPRSVLIIEKKVHTHTPQKGDISKEMYTDTQRETVIIVYVCVP